MGQMEEKRARFLSRRKKWLILSGLLAAAALVLILAAYGRRLTPVFASKYSVFGVDVSHHQGSVDWELFKEQGVQFAYIKATEGSSHTDTEFFNNLAGADAAGIAAGVYHFFSFDSSPETQAEHFISTAGELSGHLPPAVDVEYYGDKEANPPPKEAVIESLSEFLALLEKEYGKKPVIYTTYKVYHRYLKGEFDGYPLWIRNVYYPPADIGRTWTFWQYSDRGELSGHAGAEAYVDLNVFGGTKAELEMLLLPAGEDGKGDVS